MELPGRCQRIRLASCFTNFCTVTKKILKQILREELPHSELEGIPVPNSFIHAIRTSWRLYGTALLNQIPLVSLKDKDVFTFTTALRNRIHEDCRVILNPVIQEYLCQQTDELHDLERILKQCDRLLKRLTENPEYVRNQYKERRFERWGGAEVIVTSDRTQKSNDTVDLSGGQRMMLMTGGDGAADFVIVTDHPNPIVWAFYSMRDITRKTLPVNRFRFYGEMAQAVSVALQSKPLVDNEPNDLRLIRVCIEAGRNLIEDTY